MLLSRELYFVLAFRFYFAPFNPCSPWLDSLVPSIIHNKEANPEFILVNYDISAV